MAAVILLLASVCPVCAADSYSLIGDADVDGEVTILDATRIQRALVTIVELNTLQRYLADVDHLDGVTILDATAIQRRLAEISDDFYAEKLDHWQAKIDSVSHPPLSAPLTSGSSMAFHIDEATHAIPSEYEVYLDGLLLRERSSNAHFSCHFPDAGSYVIAVLAYDPFGGTDVYRFELTVLSLEETTPKIAYAGYNRNTTILSVVAESGTAPYQYQYIIRDNIAGLPPELGYVANLHDFEFENDENGNYILIRKFCEESAVFIPIECLTKTLCYTCEVQVRDHFGRLSEVRRVPIEL